MQDELFQQYANVVHRAFGIQLPPEKKTLLEARLFKVLNDNAGREEFADAASFYQYVKNDVTGKALQVLSEAITTHHTFFMREADHFQFLAQEVLPYLEKHVKDGDIRSWCAACSSGEEAYTLAMILEDYFSLREGMWETTLLATDLSSEILQVAKKGIYGGEAVHTLPLNWQNIYFNSLNNGSYQVVQEIQQKILFWKFNLVTPVFPFKRKFHVIFCRNVMIYFDVATRNSLVRKFYDFLEPGGFLFLGHSEVIDRQVVPFEYMMPSVYRKK